MSSSPSRHSIVLVDDEMDLVLLFRAFLEKDGHIVVPFSDPELALEYFKQTPMNHTLLITDLRMPGLSGIDLACSIRKLNSNIKIFLMTAFDIRDLESYPNYKDAKIDKLLQKPIGFSELRILIENL
jgi:DNA-binding response OmpR family regulator